MTQAEFLAKKDEIYLHLRQAYELAGDLRDFFETEQLKGYCNAVRKRVYELRDLEGGFVKAIKVTHHD